MFSTILGGKSALYPILYPACYKRRPKQSKPVFFKNLDWNVSPWYSMRFHLRLRHLRRF